MTDLIGQQLGPYRVTALLGRGGMATVYRARQMTMDRDVAIKVIKPELAGSKDFTARFEREAKVVASLSHPHILKVFDYGQHADMGYLVMEYLAGGSLADLIERGTLPIDRTIRFFDQIAPALDYAHRQGIIHRDLKPQNVLLDDDQNVMLTDFGLAKLAGKGTQLTHTGLTVGTPAYMAPEQWQGSNIDKRADIYSLGVMLYEMLSGTLPFAGDTPFRVMHMHIYEFPALLIERDPKLPPGVDVVIMKALGKQPDERYASVGAMVAALREAFGKPAVLHDTPFVGLPTDLPTDDSFSAVKLISIAQSQPSMPNSPAADGPRSRPTASIVQRPSLLSSLPVTPVGGDPSVAGNLPAQPAGKRSAGMPQPFRAADAPTPAGDGRFRDPVLEAATGNKGKPATPAGKTKKSGVDAVTVMLALLVVMAAVAVTALFVTYRRNVRQVVAVGNQQSDVNALSRQATATAGIVNTIVVSAPTIAVTPTATYTPPPTRTLAPTWTSQPTRTVVVSRPRATVRAAVATRVAVVSKPIAVAKAGSPMYASPGTDYPLVPTLRANVQYEVLLRSEVKGQAWYQLRFDGTRLAWVPGTAITITPANADIPFVPPPPDGAPPPPTPSQ